MTTGTGERIDVDSMVDFEAEVPCDAPDCKEPARWRFWAPCPCGGATMKMPTGNKAVVMLSDSCAVELRGRIARFLRLFPLVRMVCATCGVPLDIAKMKWRRL